MKTLKAFALTGLLALAAFAATPQTSQAGGSPFGCGAFCICNFGKMHQHGPLYNYGPYSGYYPFAPYGPWNSDLTRNNNCASGNCGGKKLNLHLPQLGHKSGCGTGGWSHYSLSTFKNVFHRTHPCSHKAGCNTYTSAAPLPFSPIVPVAATEAVK
ncbi:hypothetical protein BH11PLA2_BH11PLA2_10670 [soil metagenome]